MNYHFAVYLGPVLMLRTITRIRAERVAKERWGGRAKVVEQFYTSKGRQVNEKV